MLSFAYVLINIATAAAAAAAQAAPAAEPEQPPTAEELSSSRVQEALGKCGERRFLSIAEALVDGDKRRATILLCAKPGDSDAQWATTLEKSAAQIAASPQVTDESKARLRGEFAAAVAKARSGPVPDVAVTGGIGATGLTGVAAIPPLKMPDRRPRTAPLAAADALVANVPPLPAPLPPRAAQASLLANMLPQPRISIRCLESGEHGRGMECDEVRINTTLVVRAEENFPSTAALRFMRKGDARADHRLGNMRKGQVVQLRLPGEVCRGTVRSELEVETVVANPRTGSEQTRRALGPVTLRC